MGPENKQNENKQNNNPLVSELSKWKGSEVEVFIYSGGETIKMSGVCAAVDFGSKAMVLMTPEKKVLIPRYMYAERVRSNPGVESGN